MIHMKRLECAPAGSRVGHKAGANQRGQQTARAGRAVPLTQVVASLPRRIAFLDGRMW
jgi:hypothetical protein